MKFLIHSAAGHGAGLAYNLSLEGHEVYIYLKEQFSRPILSNMVPHVSSVEEGLSKKPDVVIFDVTGDGKLADNIKQRGFRVVGGSSFCDLIEQDRSYSMKLAKKVGIKTPNFTLFSKKEIDRAIQFVDETNRRYVLKLQGYAAIDLTYVSKDPGDMIHELEWIRNKGILKDDFLLQEFVDGYELSTEVWFHNGDPIPALSNGTSERKSFLTGDIGPNTECESSVVWSYGSDRGKIVEKTMWKMYPIIKAMKYTGPIDINSIISKQDGQPYFLEFTPRLGYSSFYAASELIEGSLADFFYNVSVGKTDDLVFDNDKVGIALTMSIPPYPLDWYEKQNHAVVKKTEGKSVIGIPETGFWPYDVMYDKKLNQFTTAGASGLVCYLTANGMSIEEAEDRLYRKAENFEVPNVQYRIDAGEKAMEICNDIKQMGYQVPICKIDEQAKSDSEDIKEMETVGFEEED